MTKDVSLVLAACLQELHLPAVKKQVRGGGPATASAETWSYPDYLRELMEGEDASSGGSTASSGCCRSRSCRWRRAGRRWTRKARLPPRWCSSCKRLVSGDLVDPPRERAGLRSTGFRGRRTPWRRWRKNWCELAGGCCSRRCSLLVQDLLVAKLRLDAEGVVETASAVGGDSAGRPLGYGVQQSYREEMEVPVTLLAERCTSRATCW